MSSSEQHFDLLIVGGGLAGLALACALRDSRLKIALIEQRAPSRPSGWDARVYAISPANVDFLRQIGVWKHLATDRLTAIQRMEIAGDAHSRLEFSAYETGIAELGWVLESSLMACELWECIKRQSNLTLFSPAAPTAISIGTDSANLTLVNGKVLSARLLVGADGRDSWLRNAAGLPAVNIDYGEMGVVATFNCQHAHRGVARQWFRADGILAWLPLAGNRLSIVWSAPEQHARKLLSLSPQALSHRIAAAGQHALGEFDLLTPAAAFPLRLMRVPRTYAARLALIGDAAHGIHPLSGHGINLGFQDAKVLGKLLLATPEWQDIGDERLLARYQRERREETLLMQGVTHALQQLYRHQLPGLKILRNLGMNAINHLPILKNTLVRYAIGAL
ncbi:MAG TPA: UbiH/UbiF family hydroxylase [Accumulibacter sp.]|nr:UbiH/UbiF family hydroxylase [Accumulibacter sp.]